MVRMRFFEKGMNIRMILGGLILFSGLTLIFPKSVGLIVGLLLGVIIMVMEQLGLKMNNWGRELGGLMGKLVIGFGEWMGSSAMGFARIVESVNLLHFIQMFGLFVMIIAGAALIGVIYYSPNKTEAQPAITT